jgi:hypothetical protein
VQLHQVPADPVKKPFIGFVCHNSIPCQFVNIL